MSGLKCFGCLHASLLLLQDLPQEVCTEPNGGHHVSQDGIDFVGSTANVQGPPSCRQAHFSTHHVLSSTLLCQLLMRCNQ